MRRATWLSVLALGAVLWASQAQAQYANRALGGGVGLIGLTGGDTGGDKGSREQ